MPFLSSSNLGKLDVVTPKQNRGDVCQQTGDCQPHEDVRGSHDYANHEPGVDVEYHD
ncbi:hypothetical protein ICL16_35875 [Iningainema sp. BLCCT55]|uniref:Uncharacterized protein n=1 Tax=Iningainema tapete BLCC-T55 TaxID=2748662 RepID=A0A8J7BZC3_9CYAN|nr:hypothetical protein [Iningainema tapete BLCC-T55]